MTTPQLNGIDHLTMNRIARITGGVYVAYIVASVLADVLGKIGLGTAEQVSQAIATNEWSFRLGLVVALTSGFLFLMVAWGLYVLLRTIARAANRAGVEWRASSGTAAITRSGASTEFWSLCRDIGRSTR